MIEANRCLQPPVESYVQPGATLYCELASSLANEIVTVTYRLIELEKGIVHLDAVSNTVAPGDGISFNVSANLPECFLFAISVTCQAAQMRGETYVRVKLKAKDGKHLTTFLRGYITNTQGLSYPPIYLQDSLSGMGARKVWRAPSPFDPFQDFIIVPSRRLWRVQQVSFVWTTSAVVADRLVNLYVLDESGGALYYPYAHSEQPSSIEADYKFIRGIDSRTLVHAGTTADVMFISTALGDLELLSGYQMGVNVDNLDAGDVGTFFSVFYEEFLLPDQLV